MTDNSTSNQSDNWWDQATDSVADLFDKLSNVSDQALDIAQTGVEGLTQEQQNLTIDWDCDQNGTFSYDGETGDATATCEGDGSLNIDQPFDDSGSSGLDF